MSNKKSTKRALLMSVVSLLLCCSMLVGTTYAWFTDEVASMNNVITAGNLDVEVTQNGTDIREIELFEDILWEPGVVAYETLTVENVGTLALWYDLRISFANQNTVTDNGLGLAQVLKYAIVDGEFTEDDRDALTSNPDIEWNLLEKILARPDSEPTVDEVIVSKRAALYPVNNADNNPTTKNHTIVIWWEPSAEDNKWNLNNDRTTSDGEKYLHIDLGINVFATQVEYERDSFGDDYDKNAVGDVGSGTSTVNPGSGQEIHVRNGNGSKIGAVIVPAAAIADQNELVAVNYSKSNYVGNFTVANGYETLVYDITATNLVENNQTPVTVYIRLAEGLDPATVTVYHEDTLVDSVYDPNSGYVIFETTSFSPFTAVYDAESVYVPTDPEGKNLPVASVVKSPEYENTELPWGSYGQWSPTAGLDANLEAAYTFSCVDTPEEAEASEYANWYCDFYVKLDKDLGANEIFLGGNYGSFGWVGFHNGELELPANTEIPLLGSVTTNPWTYAQVASAVGTFICGVGDVDDALSGATFTVMLRLTNPENLDESYPVATIEYTFE